MAFNTQGTILESEFEIMPSSSPAAFMVYVKNTYEEDDVKEASKITKANVTNTYEAEVHHKDLSFYSIDNFIKSPKN